jgi:hypothetical protein
MCKEILLFHLFICESYSTAPICLSAVPYMIRKEFSSNMAKEACVIILNYMGLIHYVKYVYYDLVLQERVASVLEKIQKK